MNQISLSIADRGFLFGEGVFRTLKVQHGKVLHWQEHLHKLKSDCQFLSLPFSSISEEEILGLINEKQATQGSWRLKIICTQSLFMTLEPYCFSQERKKLTVFPQTIEKPSAKIKSLSYLDNLLVSKYASEHGNDDALILNHKKAILECSRANFLWVHRDSMYFTDPSLPYYEGVMQQLCLKAARQLGMNIQPCSVRIKDLPGDANLFTSNAMQGLIPVTQIAERTFLRDCQLEKEFRQKLNSL